MDIHSYGFDEHAAAKADGKRLPIAIASTCACNGCRHILRILRLSISRGLAHDVLAGIKDPRNAFTLD